MPVSAPVGEVSQLHGVVIAEEDCQRGTYYGCCTVVAPPNELACWNSTSLPMKPAEIVFGVTAASSLGVAVLIWLEVHRPNSRRDWQYTNNASQNSRQQLPSLACLTSWAS